MNLMLSIVVVVSVVRRTATSAASATVFSVDCNLQFSARSVSDALLHLSTLPENTVKFHLHMD